VQQEPAISQWRVVVLCPSRQLNFGDPAPVAEFVEQRVRWIELLSATTNPTAPALVQALALLLQSEQDLPTTTAALRARVAGSSQAAEIDDVIAAILVARFNGRSIQELCAMGGITLDDFTQSVAYREIFGRGEARGVALGEARGEARGVALGQAQGEAKVTLRQLSRRCGPLSAEQESVIRSLPLERLEALAEALLDFDGMADLNAWLAANT
jgi:predicted transposase YdaD